MNNLALLSALVFEPRKAFDEIAQRPRFWFPLLLLLVASVGLSLWYVSVVDIQWLTDQTLRTSGLAQRMTEEQIEAAIARSGRGGAVAQAVIGGTLALVVLRLLESVYLLLAGKITNVQRSFRQWFALSCWTSLQGVHGRARTKVCGPKCQCQGAPCVPVHMGMCGKVEVAWSKLDQCQS